MIEVRQYRSQYDTWGAILDVEYDPELISLGQLTQLFRVAGYLVGIGDFRLERDGLHGGFKLVSEQELAAWRKEARL